jgi:hypothetical protein
LAGVASNSRGSPSRDVEPPDLFIGALARISRQIAIESLQRPEISLRRADLGPERLVEALDHGADVNYLGMDRAARLGSAALFAMPRAHHHVPF